MISWAKRIDQLAGRLSITREDRGGQIRQAGGRTFRHGWASEQRKSQIDRVMEFLVSSVGRVGGHGGNTLF